MVLLIVETVRGQPCLTPELFLSLLLCQMELFLKCDLDCSLQTPVISEVFIPANLVIDFGIYMEMTIIVSHL